MKNFLLTLAAGLSLNVARGVELSPVELKDRLKVYSALGSFRSQFTQLKKLKEIGVELKSSGTLTVRRPHQVIWEVKKPSPLTLKMDGKTLTISKGGNETTTLTGGIKGIDRLVAWLRLDAAEISQAYSVSRTPSGDLECRPRKAESHDPLVSIKLHLREDGTLSQLTLDERSGDQLEISFNKPENVP